MNLQAKSKQIPFKITLTTAWRDREKSLPVNNELSLCIGLHHSPPATEIPQTIFHIRELRPAPGGEIQWDRAWSCPKRPVTVSFMVQHIDIWLINTSYAAYKNLDKSNRSNKTI